VPTLLAKRGARDVLAVDYSHHCLGKMEAVRRYHGMRFEYRSVGLMYRLHEQLHPRGFDLVNCSGILYHVFSPLTLLAAARPLVKRGGLMLAAVPVTLDPGYTMDFNAAGRIHSDANTFWYPSARLFDYLLRYMRLAEVTRVSGDSQFPFEPVSASLEDLEGGNVYLCLLTADGTTTAGGARVDNVKVRCEDPARGYYFASGTSFAAPHVSGAAALVKSHMPGLSVGALWARILQNVDPLPSLAPARAVSSRPCIWIPDWRDRWACSAAAAPAGSVRSSGVPSSPCGQRGGCGQPCASSDGHGCVCAGSLSCAARCAPESAIVTAAPPLPVNESALATDRG
jgi:SAM-dependent methyltransferase